MSENAGVKCIFLDRDGVINIDHGYVSKIEDFEFVDGLFPVLRHFIDSGYLLIIVTNQSGIGRGYYTREDFTVLTEWMLKRFDDEGVRISEVYSCHHSPEEHCACRKPAPGMLLQAIRKYRIDPAASWMIGDKDSDMAAAESAGIRTRVLIGTADSGHSTHEISKLNELLELSI